MKLERIRDLISKKPKMATAKTRPRSGTDEERKLKKQKREDDGERRESRRSASLNSIKSNHISDFLEFN